MADEQDTDDNVDNVAVEREARQLGWVPQEKFRGNPDLWVDAGEFVKRGATIMPMLKQNNKKLQNDVGELTSELIRLRGLVQAGQESMQGLLETQEETLRRGIAKEKRILLDRLKDARENGTVEEEFAIQEELTELNATAAVPTKKKEEPKQQQQQQRIDPAFVAWQEENNDWFGPDKRKTALAVGIAEELRSDPANADLKGKAFYDRVSEELDNMLSPPGKKHVDKVAPGSRPSGGNGGGGGGGKKTYASLPADAKEVCDRQEKKMVGEGRAFKDAAAWKAHYVQQYFRGEE